MSFKWKHRNQPDKVTIYQIRVRGHLGREWADWFGGMRITQENGDTLLTGPVADQAALYGLLRRIRDTGLLLISVNLVEADQEDLSDTI